jgi:hypothetical protein
MTLLSEAPVSSAVRLPDFFILGEMRCGSTTLWELLSRHPRVFFSEEKEAHFFDGRNGRWNRGVAAYAELFAAAGDDQLCGEATPDYLFHDDACPRIREVVPDARLIAILRDPVTRAWSHYWHNVRRGREVLTFEQAIDAEAQRMASGDAEQRSHCSYASRGRYVEQLRRYERAFGGREQICVTFLEDLIANPAAEMTRVCRHLGLAPVAAFADEVVPERNRAKYPRWPRLNRAANAARRLVNARAPALAAPVKWAASMSRPLRVYSGQARMPEAMRVRLGEGYRGFDEALATWVGRAVPWVKG